MATHLAKPKVFISFDVEATGPSDGAYSCIQIGARVCDYDFNPSDTPAPAPGEPATDWHLEGISVCMTEEPGKLRNASTMAFWADNQASFDRIMAEAVEPVVGMARFNTWLKLVYDKYSVAEWVAAPSSFDWQWVNTYYHRYVPRADMTLDAAGNCCLPYSITCMSSMVKTLGFLGHDTKVVWKYMEPEHIPYTHYALDDSDSQGYQYLRLRKYLDAFTLVKR